MTFARRAAAAANSVTKLPESSECLHVASGLHRANTSTDILKSCRGSWALPFKTSQVELILKNHYAAENQPFLEESGQGHPCSLVLEWMNAGIF